MRRHPRGLLDRLGTSHMYDLDDGNPRQCVLQIAMRALGETIADLDRIRAAEVLLLDDDVDASPRSQKKCPDRRWNGRGDLGDELIVDDAGPARHTGYQA